MEFKDNYEHEVEGILYFPRNLPTREVENIYQYYTEGCKCSEECVVQSCQCLLKSGTAYEYMDKSNLESYKLKYRDEVLPTFECNSNCLCNKNICGNKLVQLGPRQNLEVKLCKNVNKGLGLFTSKSICAGNFICEYAGEVLTEAEAKIRYQLNSKNDMKTNYIFYLKEAFGEKLFKTFIDPSVYGNIGRYINHSCNPNSNLLVIRENSTMPILAIFAARNIEANEEITYNYGEEKNTEQSKSILRKPCFCNESNCMKYLPYEPNLEND